MMNFDTDTFVINTTIKLFLLRIPLKKWMKKFIDLKENHISKYFKIIRFQQN